MKKRKKLIIALLLLLTTVILSVIYFVGKAGILNPISSIALNNITDVAIDDSGNSYILNEGGYEIIRLNFSGQADLYIKGESLASDSFYRANSICADSQGNIYVLNIVPDGNGSSWIGEENITVFDKNGHHVKTVCHVTHEIPALKPSIISVKNCNNSILAISAKPSAILLNNVNNGDIEMFPFVFADRYINSADFDPENDKVYATTYDGRILELTYNSVNELYKLNDNECEIGCFTDIEYTDNGLVYICDAKAGSISLLNDNTFTSIFKPHNTPYSFDYSDDFAFNCVYSFTKQDSGRYYGYSILDLTTALKNKYFMYYVLWIIAILLLIYPVISFARYFAEKVPSKSKMIAGISAIVLVLTIAFCIVLSNEFTALQGENILHESAQDAQIVNTLIDEESFLKLKSSTDFYSPEYLKIKQAVDSVILENGKYPGDFYLMMYTVDENYNVNVRYSLEEMYGCNYPYIWSDGTGEASIYESGETVLLDETYDSQGSYICAYAPITDSKNAVIGVIEVGTNLTMFRQNIGQKVTVVAIAIIALAVVFVLIILECIEFMDAKKKISFAAIKSNTAKIPLKLYRIIIFLVFFVTSITIPFLSLYAVDLAQSYSSRLGIPTEILAAIPISAEVFFGALLSITGGAVISKMGYRKASLIGCICFTLGLSVRFFYSDLIVLTIGNSMQGAGWGIILLVVTAFFASESDEALREEGFTHYNIALRNGTNSGIVLGGFLLTFSDYNSILIIVTILSLIVMLISYYIIYDKSEASLQSDDVVSQNGGILSYVKFIFKPRVLIYFIFITIPVVAASYYLNFLYPILADDAGLSEDLIGYSFLFNGLVVICFGNIIVGFMSKHFSKKTNLMLASIIYLITFVLVGQSCTVAMLIISLVLIAVSDSFGYVAQSTLFAELKEVDEFGQENALGVYSLFENLSQCAGSFIFGYILAVGIKTGLSLYGIVIGVCGIIFAVLYTFFSRRVRKTTV